jgi:hypothetical protein
VWLNPERRESWDYTASVRITRELVRERMFPLTISGLDQAIRELKRPLGVANPGLLPAPGTPVTQHPPPYVP